MIKRVYVIVAMLYAAIQLISCGTSGAEDIDISKEQHWLKLETQRIEFTNVANSQTIKVSTDGTWAATSAQSWIHISPNTGTRDGSLSISVDANNSKDQREGTVDVISGQATKHIIVVQTGCYFICGSATDLSDSRPATMSVTINSNTDWTATADVDWLQVNPASGNGDATLTINVDDNPSLKQRNGTVTLKSLSETKVLSISQPGKIMTVDCTELQFNSAGGQSEVITVITDGEYSITPSDSWITVQQSDNTFVVNVSACEGLTDRNGIITIAMTGLINGETLVKTITIKQVASSNIGFDGFGEDEDWNY